MTSRSSIRSSTVSLALAAVLFSPTAQASPDYPDALQKMLDMPCMPVCTICHTDSLGGRGTVTQPFGIDMRHGGLVAADVGSLKYAVDSLDNLEIESRYLDADKDGTLDIDELRQGTNPNGDTEPLCSDLHYGCRVKPGSRDGEGAWFCALSVAVVGLCRRRRR